MRRLESDTELRRGRLMQIHEAAMLCKEVSQVGLSGKSETFEEKVLENGPNFSVLCGKSCKLSQISETQFCQNEDRLMAIPSLDRSASRLRRGQFIQGGIVLGGFFVQAPSSHAMCNVDRNEKQEPSVMPNCKQLNAGISVAI